jgi:hypothetical protein
VFSSFIVVFRVHVEVLWFFAIIVLVDVTSYVDDSLKNTKSKCSASSLQPYPDPYAPNPDPYAQYPNQPAHGGSAGSGSGLSGLINKASTAVAGLGLASGVTGILGSLTGGGVSLNEPRLKPCMTTSPIRFYLRFFRFFNFYFQIPK